MVMDGSLSSMPRPAWSASPSTAPDAMRGSARSGDSRAALCHMPDALAAVKGVTGVTRPSGAGRGDAPPDAGRQAASAPQPYPTTQQTSALSPTRSLPGGAMSSASPPRKPAIAPLTGPPVTASAATTRITRLGPAFPGSGSRLIRLTCSRTATASRTGTAIARRSRWITVPASSAACRWPAAGPWPSSPDGGLAGRPGGLGGQPGASRAGRYAAGRSRRRPRRGR